MRSLLITITILAVPQILGYLYAGIDGAMIAALFTLPVSGFVYLAVKEINDGR